ncbi:MAG: hypothetical protein F6K26_52420 [Moorea sp. SIO2I5]|nr:hypothetical protein [Moorena sp. SIO2I5]
MRIFVPCSLFPVPCSLCYKDLLWFLIVQGVFGDKANQVVYSALIRT